MKFFATIGMLLFTHVMLAQSDTTAIKGTIATFFKGMHTGDTMLIKSTVTNTCSLKSVMQNKSGNTMINDETMAGFYSQVASLKGQQIEERLLGYDIKIDGALAIAWTPYEFYFNGQFSHCGVNVFTLILQNGNWTIAGITDTRRKNGCH